MSELPHSNVQIVSYPPPDHPAARTTRAQARRYEATQPFIVNKTPFFHRIGELAGPAPHAIFEPGCGPGEFLEFWAAESRRALSRSGREPVQLVGCDLSSAMIERAADKLREALTPVRLISGVDALDPASPLYQNEASPAEYSLIVLSQFEHCAPNDRGSQLARRLEASGVNAMTKSELRRLMHSLLRPGGWLFVIDDFRAADADQEAAWSAAWDRQVVRRFADLSVLGQIARQDGAMAARLALRYAVHRPESERLALARRARERRRTRNWEETQRLEEARHDFTTIFGAKNSGLMPHPSQETHPQFFMLWGRRSEGKNPKSEIRNPKQTQISGEENSKR